MPHRRQFAVLAAAALLAVLGTAVALGFGAGGLPQGGQSGADGQGGIDAGAFAPETGADAPEYRTSGGMENGGVFVLDYDGDGWPDLLATGGDEPALFENDRGRFDRVSLPRVRGDVRTALALDHDRDGDPDLLLFRSYARPVLLANTESGFERRDAGFEKRLAVPKSASAADYDGDGCLDVFVAQNADWDNTTPAAARAANVGSEVAGTEDNGNPNYLYRGTCGGFERVADAGIEGKRWSLATSFVDLTGDGRPDVHVANDFNNDVVYVNRGNGTFEQRVLGERTDRNGMSSEVADVNGDARPDVFVTNIYLPSEFRKHHRRLIGQTHGNNLLINQGNGSFADRAPAYNVTVGGWGWAAVIADFDNDGDRDLFHTVMSQSVPFAVQSTLREQGVSVSEYVRSRPYLQHPRFFERSGERFEARNASRLGFRRGSSTGVAALDHDRDGDLDLAVATSAGPLTLYENRMGGRSLSLRVRGDSDTPAIGAKVFVTVGGETRFVAVNARADFLSQDSRVVHVGLGDADGAERVRVVWPDGTERTFTDLAAGSRYVVSPNGTIRRDSAAG